MGEKSSPACARIFSGKSLLKLAARARGVLSALKRYPNSRREMSSKKAPIRIIPHGNAGHRDLKEDKDLEEKDYFSVTPPTIPPRSSSLRRKTSCYLCKLNYKNITTSEIDHSLPLPHPPISISSVQRYLPIKRTQPPNLPLRSSSLPLFIQLQRLALRKARPSAPLSHVYFSQKEGMDFQWLVLQCFEGVINGCEMTGFSRPAWDLIMKICYSEPSIRHIVLAVVASLRRKFSAARSRHSKSLPTNEIQRLRIQKTLAKPTSSISLSTHLHMIRREIRYGLS